MTCEYSVMAIVRQTAAARDEQATPAEVAEARQRDGGDDRAEALRRVQQTQPVGVDVQTVAGEHGQQAEVDGRREQDRDDRAAP